MFAYCRRTARKLDFYNKLYQSKFNLPSHNTRKEYCIYLSNKTYRRTCYLNHGSIGKLNYSINYLQTNLFFRLFDLFILFQEVKPKRPAPAHPSTYMNLPVSDHIALSITIKL
jgi:hypothetical protein